MYQYRCYGCGGMCDAGELENGVCYDCRQEDIRRMEQELVELGIHREHVYKRQHEAYEMEERTDGELRSTGTAAGRKDHL